jgi:hypothetical protein
MPSGLTVNFKVALVVWGMTPESVTVKVIGVAVAVAVGVPEINPVAPSSVIPAGSAPDEMPQENGAVPPVDSSVVE